MQQPVSDQPAAWRAYFEQNQAAQSSATQDKTAQNRDVQNRDVQSSGLSSEQSAVGNRVRQSSSAAAASEGNFSETDSDAADSAETSNSD
ncbi:MAG: hypothetical protein U0L31_00750 [Bifidobacteriaceae bacterium]|nr:hypothetical protein [Bifidobacteriaceae bacterium]MEE0940435.1 hypothetical protein [Bifidobacteriaceae bacterium]